MNEVELHATCYSLYTFEDLWRKWSTQVPVLCQLLRDFGYTVSAIDSSLLDSEKTEAILNNSRQGFRLYNDIVKDDLKFLLKLLENNDFYDLLLYSNKVVLLNGNMQRLHSNEHRVFVTVSNVPQCFRFIRGLRMLSKYYSKVTMEQLWSSDSSLAKLEQVVQTVELLDLSSNDRLSSSNTRAIQYVTNILFEGKDTVEFNKTGLNYHLGQIVTIYSELYDLHSQSTNARLYELSYALLKRLANQETRRRGNTPNVWKLKQIPAFDSNEILMTIANQQLVMSLFRQSLFEKNNESKSSDFVKLLIKDNPVKIDFTRTLRKK
jgi:hypothetical protein